MNSASRDTVPLHWTRTAAAVSNIMQLMQKFHVFFAIRMFIAVFTRSQQGSQISPVTH